MCRQNITAIDALRCYAKASMAVSNSIFPKTQRQSGCLFRASLVENPLQIGAMPDPTTLPKEPQQVRARKS
ncbi:hypothetical protein C7B82_10910 [Stenomitos frigidus ULC18]|uniref:Uncharacterized protein n=1 Tax=Stenomitos frigidus ULC18 TaxID=2107698 RepID=A0A2T1E9X5_9CYAN|nr:hypothetical protein C7B82_10910 [Stenomitos frigidus ULC18]